jgi:DNA-binding response OmpR family regulator
MKQTILLVEHELGQRTLLKSYFIRANYRIRSVRTGQEAIEYVKRHQPVAMVLAWYLPDMEGIEVCKQIRIDSSIPIIMMSESLDEFESVLALELGATDFIRKPVRIHELHARIRLHVKNEQFKRAENYLQPFIQHPPFLVDYTNFRIYKNQQVLTLTDREFKVLAYLIRYANEVISRQLLLTLLAIEEKDVRTIDVLIHHIREKIEENINRPSWIKTKNGAGYYFVSKDM